MEGLIGWRIQLNGTVTQKVDVSQPVPVPRSKNGRNSAAMHLQILVCTIPGSSDEHGSRSPDTTRLRSHF